MDVKPIAFDPVAVWGIIWGLISAGGLGLWHVGKIILKTRRARRMLAAGLDFKVESEDNNREDSTLTSAILQFLKHQEAREAADRQDRSRQWERIEESLILAREHSAALMSVISTIQNFAQYMDQTHRHQSNEINEVKQNQIRISEWMRENRGGNFAYPPFQQHPPPPRTQQS